MPEINEKLHLLLQETIYVIDAAPPPPEAKSYQMPEPALTEAAEPPVTYVTKEQAPQKAPLPVHGNANAQVLVVINDPTHDFLAPGDAAFLQEILKAIKITMAHVAVVNVAIYKADAHDVSNLFDNCNKVLAFQSVDFLKGQLPIDGQQPYFVQEVNGTQVIMADGLEQIREDRNKKLKLWTSLKEVFLNS